MRQKSTLTQPAQPRRPFPWLRFIQDTARNAGIVSCLSFLLYMTIGTAEIGTPSIPTVLVVAAIGALVAYSQIGEA